jgi:hypothetical protein
MTVIFAKGSTGDRMTMKTTARRSPADRDRAVARLRALTIGTSIAGVAAVGGFGTMAALSYDGASSGTVGAIVTADGGTTTSGTTSTRSGATTTRSGATTTAPGTTTTTTGSTTTTTGRPVTGQATAAPTAATGTAHATTGSS